MKKIFALILTILVGSSVLFAQSQTVEPVNKKVTWNETAHDFGTINKGDPAKVTFTMKNGGETPVIITQAKSSCGCTVAEYTKEPVKPGETGIVSATYNSARVGKFTKTVTVSVEGTDKPQVLTIKGEVLDPNATPKEETPESK